MPIAFSASIAVFVLSACSNPAQLRQTTAAAETTITGAIVDQGQTRLALQIGNARTSVILERDAAVARDASPIRIDIVAKVPGSAIVLTDTYPSLAGGLSYCQAGEERFLRVIATAGAAPTKSYDTKVQSCRDNLELADPGIQWDARTATVRLHWLLGPNGKDETRSIAIRSDGGVNVLPQSR